MKPYVVRQGDHLLKIAHQRGFEAASVWSHSKNAELKRARKHMEMLRAGDILFLPDEPRRALKLTAESDNKYVAEVPRIQVSVVMQSDEEPIANEKYRVLGLGEGEDDKEYTTDAAGTVSFEAAVHIREALVCFVNRELQVRVGVGDLDPVDTPSGQRMRLENLGFYGGALTGEDAYMGTDADKLAGALSAFQRQASLPLTGEADADTLAALEAAHGS